MRKSIGIALLVCIALLLALAALGQSVPSTITYQGKLTDASGNPVPDGSRSMQFKLYSASSGGTPLWDSGALNVVTTGGVFSVALGSPPTPVITSPTLGSGDVWVEVKVGTDSPLPRVQLASAPFALRSSDLAMPFTKTVTSSPTFTPAFEVKNTTANYAIRGEANNASYAGVMGANTGSGFGVYGHSQSGMGVRGYQQDSGNLGVLGGPNYGVLGSSGTGYGVWGSSTSGYAGYFDGNVSIPTGRVAIGMSTAGAKLDVSDLMRVQGSTWPTTGEGLEIGYNPSLNRGYIQPYDRSSASWGDLYLGDGRVGIGTAAPVTKLEVTDVIRVRGTTAPASGEGLELGYDTATNTGLIRSYDRGGSTWGNLYLGNGNVGIGTSTPSARLDVTGSAKVSGNLTVSGSILGVHGGGPFPKPSYDSGWINLPSGTSSGPLWHMLGGNVNDYVVDLAVEYDYQGSGPTNHYVGAHTYWRDDAFHNQGVYWSMLTTNWIHVLHENDGRNAWIRVRIWVCQ